MKTSLRIASIQRIAGLAVLITAVALNAMLLTGCDDGGGDNRPVVPYVPYQPPPPTATFAALEFFPSSWGDVGEYQAEQWETNNQIKLSSFFTQKKPKQGDVLRFKISGKSDTPLKYIKIELGECVGGDWSTYNYLGSSWTGQGDKEELKNLSTTFTNVVIDVPIFNPTNSNASIYAQLVNLLWQKDSDGNYQHNSNETLPANFEKGTVMATVTNFSISLVSIDSSHNIDKNYGWNVWKANDSTATMTSSISSDGVCTVTVGGTPEKHESGAWNAWKVSAEYAYTGKANTCYVFKFEAWTDSGVRDLHVQYYNDNTAQIYLGEGIPITSARTTYTIFGEKLPKAGTRPLSFQIADQLGTVNLRIIEIKELVIGNLSITGIPAKANTTSYRTIWGNTAYYEKGDSDSSGGNVPPESSGGGPIVIAPPIPDFELGFGESIYHPNADEFWPRSIRIAANNTVTIPVWDINRDDNTYAPFTGTKTVASNFLMLVIDNYDTNGELINAYLYTNKAPITFTNGNATINFSTQMQLTDTYTPGEDDGDYEELVPGGGGSTPDKP